MAYMLVPYAILHENEEKFYFNYASNEIFMAKVSKKPLEKKNFIC